MRRVVVGFLALVLAGLAFVSVLSAVRDPVRWTPDALYYEARLLEFRGTNEQVAMRQVFQGPLSARLREADPAHTGNAAWVKYNEPFYERRVSFPFAGSILYPLAGTRSLLYLSLAGYIASIVALFALLLLRFKPVVATAVTLATIVLPPLTSHSSYPLTDSWGLALEIAAFAAALVTLDRGLRWLPLWIGAIGLLSVTRDSTWIPVLAAGWVAFRYRTRIPVALFASGFLAALPALLLLRAPARDLLALLVNNSNPAPDPSWSFIARHYPAALVDLVRSDVGFLRRGEWYTTLYLCGGVVALLAMLRRRAAAPFSQMLLAATVLSFGYVLAAPMFSAFRLELVFVPMAAFGLGLVAQQVEERVAAQLGRSTAEPVPLAARARRS